MAKSNCYLALLRGINVGGHNIISKEDLSACFEELGFENVMTYIQSGNILFQANSKSTKRLTAVVEKGLTGKFNYEARAVVISREQFNESLEGSHTSWGTNADYKHNAMFTFPETSPQEVLAQLQPAGKNIEQVSATERVLFWSASKSRLGKSMMMKLSKSKYYNLMTVRNHNTVLKLKKMLSDLQGEFS